MSLINNKFLSLTNRLQLQAQAKILQQEQQEEKKLEQQKEVRHLYVQMNHRRRQERSLQALVMIYF